MFRHIVNLSPEKDKKNTDLNKLRVPYEKYTVYILPNLTK